MNGNIDVLELNGQLDDYVSVEGTLIFGSGDMMKAIYDTNDNGIVDNAEMVNNHTVLTDVPADAVFTDTTYTAGTGISIQDGVISNTQTSAEWGNITGTLADQTDLKLALDSKASTSDIPTKVSDLDNDTGFITNAVNNLVNYYNTANSYSKTEVDTLISNINQFKLEVVQTLPVSDIDTHTIYLVPSSSAGTQNVYDEFIYVNNAWEQIGSTAIDLTNYPTFTDYPTAGGKAGVIKNGYSLTVGNTGVPSADVHTAYDYGLRDDHIFISKGTLENVLTNKSYATTTALTNGLATKQDTLVSGTNIKTINSTSLLGSGDISLEATPEISISTTQPSEDEVLWINPEDIPSGTGFELNKFYPVGSIYINTTGVNPSTFMGGTWQSFGAGKVLVGQDTTDTDFDTLLETGGYKGLQKHTHQTVELGGNTMTSWSSSGSGGIFDLSTLFKSNQFNNNQVNTGGVNGNATDGGAPASATNGNLQPYIVVSMWVRTA